MYIWYKVSSALELLVCSTLHTLCFTLLDTHVIITYITMKKLVAYANIDASGRAADYKSCEQPWIWLLNFEREAGRNFKSRPSSDHYNHLAAPKEFRVIKTCGAV